MITGAVSAGFLVLRQTVRKWISGCSAAGFRT